MPPAYGGEFRQDAIDVARKGGARFNLLSGGSGQGDLNDANLFAEAT